MLIRTRWILTTVSAIRSAFRTHVAEPLTAVHDELFRTFRDRPAIISSQDFSLSRESLLRMLADFAADQTVRASSPPTTTESSSSSSSSSVAGGDSGGSGRAAALNTPQVATELNLVSSAGAGVLGSGAGGPLVAGSSSDVDGGDEAVAAGMAVLMRSYEGELRHPLRNLLLGDLARALLIQVCLGL